VTGLRVLTGCRFAQATAAAAAAIIEAQGSTIPREARQTISSAARRP